MASIIALEGDNVDVTFSGDSINEGFGGHQHQWLPQLMIISMVTLAGGDSVGDNFGGQRHQ